MPNLYWFIVYGVATLWVSYMLYYIVISELITARRLKRQLKRVKQRQECFDNVLDLSNSYQIELQDVKKC